jgi:hypothetical protein
MSRKYARPIKAMRHRSQLAASQSSKALGLNVPNTLMAHADEVIE